MLPQDSLLVFLRWLDGLSDSEKLWSDFFKSCFDFLKNFLDFGSYTIEKQCFINLTTYSRKSSVSIFLTDGVPKETDTAK